MDAESSTAVAVVPRPQAVAPLHTFEQLERMATAVANSKLFGITTKEAALSLMLLAQAEGRHPAIAARDYHIIEGRPALKAEAMLARLQEAGGHVEWNELTDQRVSATFSHSACHPVRITWTIEQAHQAGLADRQNWKRYPRSMLRSRVISEGVRTCLPGVIVGTYTPEELQDGTSAVLPADGPSAQPIIEDAVVATSARPETPRLADSALADHLAAIESATTTGELQRAHGVAYKAAYDCGDLSAIKRLDVAKKGIKERLLQGAA